MVRLATKALIALSLVIPAGRSLAAEATAARVEADIRSGLEFLREQQSDGRDGYDAGQWRAEVTSSLPGPVGVGRPGVPYEEPTVFVAASVSNVLAEMHATDRSLDAIPALVAKAITGYSPFRWGAVFDFYPPATFNGKAVRAARYMFMTPQWQGFTNVPPDADDTSVAYLSLAQERALREGKTVAEAGYPMPAPAAKAFASFRDRNRDPHFYNGMHGDQGTGAFLTWFQDERDPKMPHDFFAPPDAGPRIPFGKNDVDCVVNTNVLKALTATGHQGEPGYRESCAYVNGVIERGEFYTCGMYYPSEYALPYAAAAAVNLGVSCLEPSRARLVSLVLGRQLPDGAWQNEWKNPHADFVQSTAWALSTLLLLGDPRDASQRAAARRGAAFLLSQAQRDAHGHLYWNGEIFYAAIYIAREQVVWRSTAYTTAVALRALLTADRKWDLFGE